MARPRGVAAGAEGVEIVASHGYLPAQFLNPLTNRREDRFGSSPRIACASSRRWWARCAIMHRRS